MKRHTPITVPRYAQVTRGLAAALERGHWLPDDEACGLTQSDVVAALELVALEVQTMSRVFGGRRLNKARHDLALRLAHAAIRMPEPAPQPAPSAA